MNIKEGPSYFTKTFQKPALLNAIGQKKVAEYEMDLIASRRYQPGTEEPAKIDCIMMPVSAGLGAFLEGEMFQQIQEFASRKMSREEKPSIRERLTQAKEQTAEKAEHRTIDREKVKVKDRSVQR